MNRRQKAWITVAFISMFLMILWFPAYLDTAKPNYLFFVLVEIALLALSAFSLQMCDRSYAEKEKAPCRSKSAKQKPILK